MKQYFYFYTSEEAQNFASAVFMADGVKSVSQQQESVEFSYVVIVTF